MGRSTACRAVLLLVLTIEFIIPPKTRLFGLGQSQAPAAAQPVGDSDFVIAKYDPPISLSAWRFLNNGIYFEPGEDIENNVFMRAYKERFGINLDYVWVVPEDQFEQKLNIAVIAGQLPDIMWLNNKQLIDLAEADRLYDLTDLFEDHLSAFTKSILLQDEAAFNTAKIKGRLMAIPRTGSAVDLLQILYIRQDWLKRLGLAVPSNLTELLEVAKAFALSDLDGDGRHNSYGLALTKNFLSDNHAGATGFFAAFHAYVQRWIKDDKGRLVYGSIQAEVKNGLKVLQDLFKAGLLDRQFGIMDRTQVAESIAAGRVGITYGGMSSPSAFLRNNVLRDPEAEWLALPLLSSDSQPALPITNLPVRRYYAVNKDCAHPEAIMKLVEMEAFRYSPEASPGAIAENAVFGITPSGVSTFLYSFVPWEPALKNLNAHYRILEALDKNDSAQLNAEELGYFDKIIKFRLTGDRNYWSDDRIFGTPSSFDVIDHYVSSGRYLHDAFYGSLTPTMVEKQAALQALETEVFTKIIMGQSLDTFDAFVADWKRLGGDQITKEVNDWYARQR